MLHLHACYHPYTQDRLSFFGEDPEYRAPKKRGRKPKSPSVVSHPHALLHDSLLEVLSGYHLSADTAEKTTITLMLPGRGEIPFLSDEIESGEDVVFIQTEIPALSIPLSYLGNLLPAMETGHSNGKRCRDSITFFRYAFGFALECISRQLFVPSSGEERYGIGQWVAIYPPQEKARAEQLSGAMPQICYSFREMKYSPEQILNTFVNSCITAIIRVPSAGK